jgi:hypothetical protein
MKVPGPAFTLFVSTHFLALIKISPMRVEFYRSLSRVLARVLDAASMYVTTDAHTPGLNRNMVCGTEWPGGSPILQRQCGVKAEARTTVRS